MPRLFQCLTCLTVEVIPDFLGSKVEQGSDPLLMTLVARHRGPLNREQIRNRPSSAPNPQAFPDDKAKCDGCEGRPGGCQWCQGTGELPRGMHQVRLHVVQTDDWISKYRREQILKQMWAEAGHVGYPAEFYAAKDTFVEDAGHCFNAHRRPQGECIDWRAEAKRLTDPKWQQRDAESKRALEAIGLEAPRPTRAHVYLCDFCPVKSYVQTQIRKAKGLYDK